MDKSTTFRTVKNENPFAQIDKRLINDQNISWKSKGILIYLLSKPNNWIARLSDIIKHSTDGRDAVRSAINELIKAGYIARVQLKENGKFSGVEYQIYEAPTNSTEDGKPVYGKTDYGKPDTINKDSSNKDSNNKENNTIIHPIQKRTELNVDKKDSYLIYNNLLNAIFPNNLPYDSECLELVHDYFIIYHQSFDTQHPPIRDSQMSYILTQLEEFNDKCCTDVYRLKNELTRFWDEVESNDHNINHFASYLHGAVQSY